MVKHEAVEVENRKIFWCLLQREICGAKETVGVACDHWFLQSYPKSSKWVTHSHRQEFITRERKRGKRTLSGNKVSRSPQKGEGPHTLLLLSSFIRLLREISRKPHQVDLFTFGWPQDCIRHVRPHVTCSHTLEEKFCYYNGMLKIPRQLWIILASADWF